MEQIITMEDAKVAIHKMNTLKEQNELQEAAWNGYKILAAFNRTSTIEIEAIKCSFEKMTKEDYYLYVIEQTELVAEMFNLN